MKAFSLKKEERLCSGKLIGNLFLEGESFFVFPLKVVYLKTPLTGPYPIQAAFAVSRKNFKRAVKRNLLKRRMREAYRLNKQIFHLNGEKPFHLAVMFIYAARDEKDFGTIEKSMKQALAKLSALK